jgi:hypothetical protein
VALIVGEQVGDSPGTRWAGQVVAGLARLTDQIDSSHK